MADSASKAQKLASARKKFKELKKEKKKTTESKLTDNDESNNSREQTAVDSLAEPIPTAPLIEEKVQEVPSNFFSYYDNADLQPQSAAFFDNLEAHNNTDNNSVQLNLNPSPMNYFNVTTSDSTNKNNLSDFFSPPTQTTTESMYSNSSYEAPPINSTNLNVNHNEVVQTTAAPILECTLPDISSVESLKQLSDEMAELIQPSDDYQFHNSHETVLELRNQELAALLSQEKVKTDQLQANLAEMQIRISQLELEVREKESSSSARNQQEICTLREELQCHVQTVGILVGEKAELSANLNQFQLSAKQKSAECEEVQNRLKAARSRVADLEREINILKGEKSHFDHLGREQVGEMEKLRNDFLKLKEEREELTQDLLEAREKLKTGSETHLNLQQQISELSGQLSMASIKIQQISTGNQPDNNLVENITQEKFNLEKQVVDLNQTIKTLSKELEESSVQYQQYAENLNNQLSNLATRFEQIQIENEGLRQQEQNRIRHIAELEKQLQNLQNVEVSFATQRSNGEFKAELDSLREVVQKLTVENSELNDEKLKVIHEKDGLVKELELKIEEIDQLESHIDELTSNQPDNTKLLASMESDKVAASRAVLQNTELKKEMESMQEVFMKLNNDKVELTEKLTSECKNNRDLIEKLQKTEIHLQTLADAIEIKDKELQNLRDNSIELDKQMIQSEQLSDRLRHYEAHDHSSHSLQNELQEARVIIAKLSEELTLLKINTSRVDNADSCNNDEVEELNRKLVEDEMRSKVNGESTDNNHNSLDKESAMRHLEEKVLKSMDQIAELTDEKQRLEHLVLQLQGETETIGEYVALYQHQRSLLKQKTIEKDQQLTQLADDREQMKSKLEKLNDLVKKLVLEKGTVTSELLQHHEVLSQESDALCEEHARIHSEINKITENNIKAGTSDTSVGNNASTETAEQIISLLSEIKTSNLVQPTENFHHCPWCSGQLITV